MADVRTRLQFRAKLFRGLCDPSRLAILEVLRPGPLTVGEIVAATGLTQSNASAHLRCLSECGLVLGVAQGRFVSYRLADGKIDQIFDNADALLADSATRVLACTNYALPTPAAGSSLSNRSGRQRESRRSAGRRASR